MRYVLQDMRQVGAELNRRATEVTTWLDARATRPPTPPPGDPPAAALAALVELACCRALSSAATRLTAAAKALDACAAELGATDTDVAERIRRCAR